MILAESFIKGKSTPDTASVSWDDRYQEERICTWVKLKDIQTEECFVYMNTHFGIGKACLQQSPEIIHTYSKKFVDFPIVITGDFNMRPDSEGYRAMAKYHTDINAVTAKDLRPTYHSYNTIPDEKKGLIDYCFIKGNIKPDDYKTLAITVDGKFPSDHHAIVATVTLEHL